jgi:membrane protease subunit HflK
MHNVSSSDQSSSSTRTSDEFRDPYRGATLALLATAVAGTIVTFVAGFAVRNPVVLEAAAALWIASGVLIGVTVVQRARSQPQPASEPPVVESPGEQTPTPVLPQAPAVSQVAETSPDATASPSAPANRRSAVVEQVGNVVGRLQEWTRISSIEDEICFATAVSGAAWIAFVQFSDITPVLLPDTRAALVATLCLVGAGLAAAAVRYLAEVDSTIFPEGPALARGARVIAWCSVLAAASVGFQWADQLTAIKIASAIVAVATAAFCYELFAGQRRQDTPVNVFPLNLDTLSALGARTNLVGSVLDAAERQLGIDLRSTWALSVVRRSVEPLVVGLGFVAWFSTALTVVGVEEQGLVERLGVAVQAPPLEPGLHLHWPWPIDRVVRLPVRRVQSLTVGHEGEEDDGPEDVLWARQHAVNEYTLLLGNGRDLITVDAAVHFRIVDPRAWQYHSQNPSDALRAVAYRAVMRNTVNRTLAEALSENVVTTTARMRAMVQQDADALELGVEVLSFTVGGMHPPVMVATDYQSVVSAELARVTAVVNAEAFRNRTVPNAQSGAIVGRNRAIAEGAEARALASGEAWSFLALQSQYGTAPGDYVFRRRLETLERVLSSWRFTVVDARIQRDGGELWLTP